MSLSSAEKLHILSHNVGQDMASPSALDMLIQQSNADIVLLQELPQTYIDEHLPAFTHVYPYQSYSPHQSLKHICMAILSRHPILREDHFKLAAHSLVYQQRAVIDIYDKCTIVYNIHLTYPRIELVHPSRIPYLPRLIYNDHIRHEEVNKLITLIRNETDPVIAGGDFNLTPRSEDYRQLVTVLKDAYTIVGDGTRRSWPVRPIPAMPYLPTIPFVRIDYLFHSSSIQPCTSQFQKKTGSDHLPLLTSIQLTNSATEAVVYRSQRQPGDARGFPGNNPRTVPSAQRVLLRPRIQQYAPLITRDRQPCRSTAQTHRDTGCTATSGARGISRSP